MNEIIESMNYRYNNPTVNLPVDRKIVEKFLEQHHNKNIVDSFVLWTSMSKENINNNLVDLINSNVKVNEEEKQKIV